MREDATGMGERWGTGEEAESVPLKPLEGPEENHDALTEVKKSGLI